MKKPLLSLIIISIGLVLCLSSIFALSNELHGKSKEVVESRVDITLVNETRTIAAVTFRQHGNVTASNSTLILRDATLEMVQDRFTKHYYISFDNNSKFVIEHSTLTSGKDVFYPWLKLNLTLRNTTVNIRNSTIAFPGSIWFENCTVQICNSSFTSLDPSGTGLDTDDNNDCPLLIFINSNITVADSKIEHYYEAFLEEQAFTSLPLNRTFQPGDSDIFQFSPSGINIVTQYLSAVVLQVTYVGEEWYNGTNSVLWSKDGESYFPTTILPGNKTATESYELFTRGIGTIEELKRIRVTFENNDSPDDTKSNITFDSVKLIFSYENDISLTNSTLCAINTYMDLDFGVADTDPTDSVQVTTPETYFIDASLTHNVLRAKFNSKVYLYNVTVDSSETGGIPSEGNPPFISDKTSQILFYKWLEIRTTDLPGTPINNVELIIESNATTVTPPSDVILEYLDRELGNYNRTLAGEATIPLLSDLILPSKWPNSEFVGNYNITARYQTYIKLINTSFEYFPLIEAEHNTKLVVISFEELIPDLALAIHLSTTAPTDGDKVEVTATIYNNGTTNAYMIPVTFYDNDHEFDEKIISVLNYKESIQISTNWTAHSTTPSELHNISIYIDKLNTIPELNENNNFVWQNIIVFSRPDLDIESIAFSDYYPIENDIITIFGTIGNSGETSASCDIEFYANNKLINTTRNILVPANSTSSTSGTFNTTDSYGNVNITLKITNCMPGEQNLQNNELNTTLRIYSAHYGDWVMETSRAIEQDFEWGRDIIVRDCKFMISNSTLTISQNLPNQYSMIVLQGGEITFYNTILRSNYPLCLYIYNSTLSAINSTLCPDIIVNTNTDVILNNTLLNGTISAVCNNFVAKNAVFNSDVTVNATFLSIEDSVVNTACIDLQAQETLLQNTTLKAAVTFESGTAYLINVTVPSVSVVKDAALYRYWWLKVCVEDKAGSPLQNATIRIFSNDKQVYLAGVNKTDACGIAILQLLAEERGTTYPMNYVNYMLNITYENKTIFENFNFKNNTEIKKTYPIIVITPTALELTLQLSSDSVDAGSELTASGTVNYNIGSKPGVENITVTITIDGAQYTTTTDAAGYYSCDITAPGAGGSYTVVASAADSEFNVQGSDQETLFVEAPPEKPVDIIPIIIAIVVIVVVVIICFIKRKLLKAYLIVLKAKLKKEEFAECTECSKKIPSALKKCPYCDTELGEEKEAAEEEHAKCSECGALIPVSAKKCPKCGAAFEE